MRNDLVVVIPAYDCAATIGGVVRGALRFVERVVVFDDGSRDDTAVAAESAGAEVIRGGRNRGKGFALRAGIEQALSGQPSALLLLDGDAQHDPVDIPSLVHAWDQAEGDLVIGSRLQDPADIPAARYWTNYIGSRILCWMTGLDLEDSQSGYRLLDADLARRLDLRSDGFEIETEMLIKGAQYGARVAHVPVRTIYDTESSHFRPFSDTVRIALWAIYFTVYDDLS